ncbi:helix-turn-helix domain-containing protein [Streptomyces spectabilis]|uniref:Helix-turn-helix domain-containing protein n=1 Tax=Streptomyces spectabilis TaxID=68270 RepID=A0A516RF61_STRST|nr:helix-turn-helix domain-containing protein [Streptomyces spectabilis]QDQ14297.1 helix-turn-helix domain-containing protein [Streptomyces spectabilis]
MSTPGERLKTARKWRGLGQEELSRESGVSASLISKLERNERTSARMETWRSLAHALHVPTMRLSDGLDEPGPHEETVEEWAAVREALHAPPAASQADAGEPPTVAGLKAVITEHLPLFKGEFSQLAQVLPGVLRDAADLGDEGQALRVRVLQLAGWSLTATRQWDLAEDALERSMDIATDRIQAAETVDCLTWLYLRRGELDRARDVAIKWADDLEPTKIRRATPDELCAWGRMLLRISAATIRDNRNGEATSAMKWAAVAARALGAEHQPDPFVSLKTFGPTTVALKVIENAAVTGQPETVLRLAKRVPKGGVRPTASNINRHMLDVADAQAKTGDYSGAVTRLLKIKSRYPEWLGNQRYAGDVVSNIAENRRLITPELREVASIVRVPL